MPKKTPEDLREKVVALRKAGATYTQIEANPDTRNPETGQKLARPTLIKILREAGLTKGVRAEAVTHPQQSGKTPSGNQSMPVQPVSPAASNGVDDFMPKAAKVKVTPKRKVEFQCSECGAEFVGDEDDELPEECPECGC